MLNTLGDYLKKRRQIWGVQCKQVAALTRTNGQRTLPIGQEHTARRTSASGAVAWFDFCDTTLADCNSRRTCSQATSSRSGLSQKECATVIRVAPSTFAKWERDERAAASEFVTRVRDALVSLAPFNKHNGVCQDLTLKLRCSTTGKRTMSANFIQVCSLTLRTCTK